MQKDFKIGLAIGVIFAVGVVLWLATLPNLSAQARALQAASNINPSLKTPPEIPSSVTSPQPIDTEIRNTNYEIRDTNDETRTRIHIVQKGDTLSSISAKYYGSAKQWRKIVNANRNNLPDPNRLVPGVKLIIPQ
jgi:nucleoid-associated protein YgaU